MNNFIHCVRDINSEREDNSLFVTFLKDSKKNTLDKRYYSNARLILGYISILIRIKKFILE